MDKKKMPNEWNRNDLREVALEIKANPQNTELKNLFMNIIPGTEEYYNISLHSVLQNCYNITRSNYGYPSSLDDYEEVILMHIFTKSFSDWNPAYSLTKYFCLISAPRGAVGYILRHENIDSISIDSHDEKSDSGENSVIDFTGYTENSFAEAEFAACLEKLLSMIRITLSEYNFLLNARKLKIVDPEDLRKLNDTLNTDYTPKSLTREHMRINQKLVRNRDRIKVILSEYFDIHI